MDISEKLSGIFKGNTDNQGTPSIKELRSQAINELRDTTDPTNPAELQAAQEQAQQIRKGGSDSQLLEAQQERTARVNELRDRTDPTNPDELAAAQRAAQQIARGPLRAGLDPSKQTISRSDATPDSQAQQNQR